jgi:hypothetical protein
MSSCTWPNYNAWLQTAWGSGAEYWSACPSWMFQGATNLVFGENPPYTLNDFLAFYPKFFGLSTAVSGCTVVNGSADIAVPNVNGLQYGQFLVGAGLQKGSVIVAIGTNQITLNQPAIADGSNITLQVYENSPIPIAVIQLYLNLAYASLVQARWQEQWVVAMGWFIAHYLTLYARSDSTEVVASLQTIVHGEVPVGAVPGTTYALSAAPPGGALQSLTKNGKFLVPVAGYTLVNNTVTLTTATVAGDALYATWLIQQQVFDTSIALTGSQIAAQGLAGGIQTSKSVGDVSVGYQVLTSLEAWGQWTLTLYGQQLVTMAKVMGQGPMVIW